MIFLFVCRSFNAAGHIYAKLRKKNQTLVYVYEHLCAVITQSEVYSHINAQDSNENTKCQPNHNLETVKGSKQMEIFFITDYHGNRNLP